MWSAHIYANPKAPRMVTTLTECEPWKRRVLDMSISSCWKMKSKHQNQRKNNSASNPAIFPKRNRVISTRRFQSDTFETKKTRETRSSNQRKGLTNLQFGNSWISIPTWPPSSSSSTLVNSVPGCSHAVIIFNLNNPPGLKKKKVFRAQAFSAFVEVQVELIGWIFVVDLMASAKSKIAGVQHTAMCAIDMRWIDMISCYCFHWAKPFSGLDFSRGRFTLSGPWPKDVRWRVDQDASDGSRFCCVLICSDDNHGVCFASEII